MEGWGFAIGVSFPVGSRRRSWLPPILFADQYRRGANREIIPKR
jgi:hypothetical protein